MRTRRIAHLTTVDMSLALLLSTEIAVDVGAGHEVFAISAPGTWVPEVESLGATHVPVPALTREWDPRRDLVAAVELLRVLRSLRLDVLHTHNPKTGVLGRVLGRAARVPVVVNTCHGLWVRPEDRLLKRALVHAVEGVAARFSHAELYQNDDDRRAMRRFVPAQRQTLVGNGVDLRRFRADDVARDRVRSLLGVTADEVLVGGVGRLVEEKGVNEFVETARALQGKARFVWAGPADEAKPDALRTRGASVQFLGMWEDMPALYNALDVFVLPSYREGFSRSGMEAAACGVACVLTDIRGCREVGQNETELLLVPPRDVQALTTAVERLVTDRALRRRLGRAAAARARVRFDQREVARTSLRTYEAVAAGRGLRWT